MKAKVIEQAGPDTRVALGDIVRDSVTGFEGIVEDITLWRFGCRRIQVRPTKLKDDGTLHEMQVFDEPALHIIKRAKATQLTLGALIEKLKALPADTPLVTSTGHNPGSFMSYRGYYEDLAFDSGEEPVTVGAFLGRAQEARGAVFEGYKGGYFPMHDKSLVWFSGYGCSSGDAPMGVMQTDGKAVLVIEHVQED